MFKKDLWKAWDLCSSFFCVRKDLSGPGKFEAIEIFNNILDIILCLLVVYVYINRRFFEKTSFCVIIGLVLIFMPKNYDLCEDLY